MSEKQAVPATLSTALGELFTGQDGDLVQRKAITANHIILGRRSSEDTLERIVHLLSLSNPGRFFLVYVGEDDDPLTLSVSKRCHQVAKGEAVCSEVISLSCGLKSFDAVPSIIRANALTGCMLELYLLDSHIGIEMYRRFGDIADRVVIDSSSFQDKQDFLRQLGESDVRLVDWQWFPLWVWRDRLVHAFNVLPGEPEHFRIIDVSLTLRPMNKKSWLRPYIATAWLTDRLGMDVVACGADGYESRVNERLVAIRMQETEEAGSDPIASIGMTLSSIGDNRELQLSLQNRGDSYHTELVVDQQQSHFMLEPGDILADEYFIRTGGMRMLSSFTSEVLLKGLDLYNLQRSYKNWP